MLNVLERSCVQKTQHLVSENTDMASSFNKTGKRNAKSRIRVAPTLPG
jgi:hypothetical protein